MKFLILNTDYPEFLRWLYAQHTGLAKQPYVARAGQARTLREHTDSQRSQELVTIIHKYLR